MGLFSRDKTEVKSVLFRNPDTPLSPVKFYASLDHEQMTKWAETMHLDANEGSLEALVADRLLLSIEVNHELLEQVETLESALTDSTGMTDTLMDELHVEKERAVEFEKALLQIQSSVCQNSRMFAGACRAAYPETILSWCPSCRAKKILEDLPRQK
jgi:hypothetical protein